MASITPNNDPTERKIFVTVAQTVEPVDNILCTIGCAC